MNALVGENGILNQSMQAKEKQEAEGVKELIQLAWAARMSKFYEDLTSGKTTYEKINEYFTEEELNQLLGDAGKILSIAPKPSRRI